MSAKIYIPGDSGAVALGADRLAVKMAQAVKARDLDAEIIRNGSRGLYWLEPMVEVETKKGRVSYGPVKPSDVDELLNAGLLEGGDHPLALGPTEDLPYLKRQTRLTFARCGMTDPLSLEDYRNYGGLAGLTNAVAMTPKAIVEQVTESGLRGRGGAGFPTGIKWNTVLEAEGPQKYIVCNADEGDSGTFADRMIMEGDPFVVIEGMVIAQHRDRCDQGLCLSAVRVSACDPGDEPRRRDCPRGRRFSALRCSGRRTPSTWKSASALSAYVCGEETALLESLEGRRGVVRAKPPLLKRTRAFSAAPPWSTT